MNNSTQSFLLHGRGNSCIARVRPLAFAAKADVSIQHATEAHLAGIAEIRAAAAFEDAVFDRLAPTKMKRFASQELARLQRTLQNQDDTNIENQSVPGVLASSFTLVALCGEVVVGSVDVSVASDEVILDAGFDLDGEERYYYVDNVVVRDDWRAQGVGAEMMKAVEQAVPGVLLVRVELNNVAALRLYAKAGFRGDSEGEPGGSTVGVFVMLSKKVSR